MLDPRAMIRRSILLFGLALAACGGSDGVTNTEDQQPMDMNTQPLEFGGRIFEFPEASVFGLNGSFELALGAMTGKPLKSTFLIKSNSNSDEASGQLTVTNDDCFFEVVMSSYPPNTRVSQFSQISATCTFDQATAVLKLADPMTGIAFDSISCSLPDDAGPCIASGGGES
jgi:hypothetical protein